MAEREPTTSRWQQFLQAAAPEAPAAWLLEKLGEGASNIKEAVTSPSTFFPRAGANLARQIEQDPVEFAMNWTGGGLGGVTQAAAKGLRLKAAEAALKGADNMTARDRAIVEAAEAAKRGFLEPSREKDVWYHGTRADIKEFKPGERGAIFLTKNKEFANDYAPTSQMLFLNELPNHPNVMPVHVQVRNPFDYENPEHIRAVLEKAKLPKSVSVEKIKDNLELGNWNYIEDKNIQKAIKDLGFDGFYIKEQGIKNLGVYDPKRIKSALGMQGRYDTESADITKSHGGAVMMKEGGPVEYDPKKVDQIADSFFKKFISLDTPQDMTAAETAADIAASFVPGLGTAQAARDLERARREGDKLGMALSAVGMVPVVGGMAKAGSKIDDLLRKYLRESLSKSPATASREVEMRSIQEALEKTNRKAAEAAEARKTDILSSPESFKSAEWPGTFYRGIRQATSGPSGEPLSQVSSLIMPQRGVNVLAAQPNNPRRTAWAASNPLTASSFASDPNSLVVPLQLTEKPSVVFNAEGAPWWRFFSQTGDLNRGSYNYPLRSEFKDMLRDPEVKTILVKDIMDTGIDETKNNLRLLSELYGVNLKPENFLSDNLLIKDPSAVRYLLTQETPKITESVKVKKAQGGAVSANDYDEGKIQALAESILEELHG